MILALAAAACASEASPRSTTAPSSSLPASSTTAAPVTTSSAPTTTAAPTTTTEPPPEIDVEILVAGADAISLVRGDLSVETLVDSPAVIAMDDLVGGVLFQVERFSTQRRSMVYRVAPGRSEAVATLIPTMEQGLTLNGVTRAGGDVYVYYTRHEGSNIEDSVDTFRRYNMRTGDVTELTDVGGWEWGSYPISVSESLVAFNWGSEALHGMLFSDLEGNSAAVAADPDPQEDDFMDCHLICPSVGELSGNGERLVYAEEIDGVAHAVIRHVASGAEIRRIALGVQDDWWVKSFDLDDDYLVVNRDSTAGVLPALLFDLRAVEPEAVLLPVAGTAHLTQAPVDIAGPVPAP